MRPTSIVSFDRLYLVAIGLGLVNSLVSFDRYRAILASDKAARQLNLGDGTIWLGVALAVGVSLLLWHLVAHKASVLAKWVLVAFVLLELANLPGSLRQLGAGGGLGILMSLAIEALRIVAVAFLFRTDAREWLGSRGTADAQG